MVDRVSALPDDILVSLVSRLPLKEAVATSVLSRRWQNVGLSTMTLRFDAIDFSIYNNLRHYFRQPKEFKEQESWNYINWVNHVVQQHRGEHIEEFRISFCLDSRFSSSINEWIQFAMENSVEMLELDFYPQVFASYEDYTFSHKLLGIGFKYLKVLQLRHVGVTGKVLECFLSNCPVLERLSVTSAKDLVNLRVVGSLIALKYLVIQTCLNLESIEIRDVNIVSLIYCGFRSTNLLISNVPLLSEVTVSKQCWQKDFIRVVFTQLSCCLSSIEILKLHIEGAAYNENPVLPLLANLKHLELLVAANYYRALHHLNNFLKASPYLQRLVLKLQLYQEGPSCMEIGEIEKAADCPHNHLKVVEIVGYRAHTSGVEHVMHLIKNVVALEKIVIDPVRTWRYPQGVDRPDTELVKEVKARDHAKQYLEAKIPSAVEFVCL
ncbi:putative F-box domain, FBD domain, leucine-rich repeat domain, L domain-containing protein [Rosa chinensis]|uniref:Putative F-box domain, FBD domain, leucine-rich repeat domain, L domain-containing protein n=1 Tax=Rosa chinensis TaxID=74649 RepID=A0A2P6R5I4_ROSCH|nr:F-box/FBD/LRR-repeat protein At5g22700 [Rosa chinensis]XP_040371788.1 F-box/FBD/LRR-repeat protein At5g22700 [Rosa chinensis]XP_040371789.1 F-box/FBD/LRR-repeat protein At5g22700 [Rosa chinensis]PRQ41693.1 putative F-box domain, FBD domain, leucine-rich repeat domain, L domain-containing protein [Rosa chinensis]